MPLYLRAWREHRKISLRDMEQTTGIARGNLSNWETGQVEPRLAGLARLAKALGIEVPQLYGPPPKAEKRRAKKGRKK
jgi:transcriptional regulator with XRE-family HTH domain